MFFAYLVSIIYLTRSQNHCNYDWNGMENFNVHADRVYYIACVEREWDYCPHGKNLVSDESIVAGTNEATWCYRNGETIGSKYMKGLYREFESNCFENEKDRLPEDEHLGALGPNIRGLTGETIKVFYKNTCSFPNSIHVHGLRYDKTSEGTPYNDGSTDGDSVEPNGGTWIYVFHARERNVDEGTSSKMWLYHSHVDEIRDIHTGLFGAVIITKNGEQSSATNLKPNDIDREFTTFFVLYDENHSLLLDTNLQTYLGVSLSSPNINVLLDDPDFIESNKMHAINGYLFGNGQEQLIMRNGEKVRWYTASLGNELDGPHSPHWHGNIVYDTLGDNIDTVVLIAGTTSTVTMDIDAPEKWLYHCHVFDHIEAGMITTYTVET